MDVENEIKNLKERVEKVEENVNKMITGLYGSLDNPDEGFIHKVNSDTAEIKTNVKDMKKANTRLMWTIIGATVVVIVKMTIGLV